MKQNLLARHEKWCGSGASDWKAAILEASERELALASSSDTIDILQAKIVHKLRTEYCYPPMLAITQLERQELIKGLHINYSLAVKSSTVDTLRLVARKIVSEEQDITKTQADRLVSAVAFGLLEIPPDGSSASQESIRRIVASALGKDSHRTAADIERLKRITEKVTAELEVLKTYTGYVSNMRDQMGDANSVLAASAWVHRKRQGAGHIRGVAPVSYRESADVGTY